MTVWFTSLTIFRRLFSLRIAVILGLCVAIMTTLLFGIISQISHAAPGINQTISFQGRLLDASGYVVPDGHYNVQFKIYQDGSGTLANNPDGTLKWTENYINNGGTGGVEVKNGFLSVNLGDVNPFGSSVDWNQDNLWLSMNIAGSAAGCTTFGSAPCVADGEMLPMKKLTASPYAINSGQLQGKTAANFIQLAQGVQEDAVSNTSSIFINKTSTGNLLQLQNTATDIFTVGNAGDLTLGSNADKTLSVAQSEDDTGGKSLTVKAGGGGDGTGSSGGLLVLQGGTAGGTDGDGGDVLIDAGAKTGTGADGSISIGTTNASVINIGSTGTAATQTINVGNNGTIGAVTNVNIGTGGTAAGGATNIQSKDDTTIATNGTQRARFSATGDLLYVGNANASGNASTANGFTIQGTSSTANNAQGGSITLQAGSATTGDANGGNLVLSGGVGVGAGANGVVMISTPVFQTASTQNFVVDGAITQANIDGNGVIIAGAATTGLTVTMNDPTITTAGRIVYVTAADGSSKFTLAINGGGVGNEVTMKENTTATLLWNGSDWTVAGASNSATLQDIFNNTLQSNAGSADLVLGDGLSSSSLLIHDDASTPIDGTLLGVQNANGSLLAVNSRADGSSNIQIGTGTGSSTPTLLTLDKASAAPTITDPALLGSMYYDTTLGQLQCYEAEGWGACSASPDNFVTLSPEYSNAVVRTNGVGTMTSDICSDSLNINDSTSGPEVCGTDETYNFYNWTSTSVTDQTRSIYVTYQLPSTFKEFVSGSTSLMGRTDSTNSNVTYQVYKNNASTGLTACGSVTSVSTGAQTVWQKAVATSTADPATCSFAAGDSIVFKIDLTAKDNANAYASTLGFAFKNN